MRFEWVKFAARKCTTIFRWSSFITAIRAIAAVFSIIYSWTKKIANFFYPIFIFLECLGSLIASFFVLRRNDKIVYTLWFSRVKFRLHRPRAQTFSFLSGSGCSLRRFAGISSVAGEWPERFCSLVTCSQWSSPSTSICWCCLELPSIFY